MPDRPIIMSGPMVQAVLREIERPGSGKTQTRRVLSPGNCTVLGGAVTGNSPAWKGLLFNHPAAAVRTQATIMTAFMGEDAPYDLHLDVPFVHPADAARGARWEDNCCVYRVRPKIKRGDRLWVKEARYTRRRESWATLHVTDVRIQRVQEISEEDAVSEGCYPYMPGEGIIKTPLRGDDYQYRPDYRAGFQMLWDSLNDRRGYGWDRNPWVAVVTFRPTLANIDRA